MPTTVPSLLPIGKVVPLFTLPDLDDRPLRRSKDRGRRHQVLLFLRDIDEDVQQYLRELAAHWAEIRSPDGSVLAVLAQSQLDAATLKTRFDLPFPLLRDTDGKVWARYLPAEARYGVFIIDRYGALHAQWALSAPPLPPIGELVEWLYVLDRQCSL